MKTEPDIFGFRMIRKKKDLVKSRFVRSPTILGGVKAPG
jgi:hypothetical protein